MSWYEPTGQPSDGTQPVSSPIRNEFKLIGDAFRQMPVLRRNNNKPVFVSEDESSLTPVSAKKARLLLEEDIVVSIKQADETRSSDTGGDVLADDAEMGVLLAGNQEYDFEVWAIVNAENEVTNTATRVPFNFSYSGTAEIVAPELGSSRVPAFQTLNGTSDMLFNVTGYIKTTTDGILRPMWSTVTVLSGSAVYTVTIRKYSFFIARQNL